MTQQKWRPGRELDKKVAEAYFKIDVALIKKSHVSFLPFYSTQFDDAWQIIENMRDRQPRVRDSFIHNLKILVSQKTNIRFSQTGADLMLWATPIDICLAALAVEGKL